jgi:hypothetical protein
MMGRDVPGDLFEETRPEVARASYTPETFGAERLFRSFAQKGLLVQDADFWCKRKF